jgi:Leucine-rich repeat (LRR) protein
MDAQSSCADEENLTHDKICAITGKNIPEEVVKLNAFALGVITISGLERFTNLQIISLSLNKIATLKSFSACKALCELHLRKNLVDDVLEIAHLSKLDNLHTLLLSDNPCCSAPRYRLKVIRTLKHLRRLDSSAISEEEFLDANCSDYNDELAKFDRDIARVVNQVEKINFTYGKAQTEIDDVVVVDKFDEAERNDDELVPQRSPHAHSNVLLAAKLLLLDMSSAETRQLMTWCTEKLKDASS